MRRRSTRRTTAIFDIWAWAATCGIRRGLASARWRHCCRPSASLSTFDENHPAGTLDTCSRVFNIVRLRLRCDRLMFQRSSRRACEAETALVNGHRGTLRGPGHVAFAPADQLGEHGDQISALRRRMVLVALRTLAIAAPFDQPPKRSSRASRFARMLLAIPSGEVRNSAKRRLSYKSTSRITSSVQRSPRRSTALAIGHFERSGMWTGYIRLHLQATRIESAGS